MAHLRGPEGCPWDRAQDYDSAKGLVLEEAYEVVDAVNRRDFEAIEEELGDLLFQVVFYSQMAREENRFSIDDVIERVHAKLVRRHPHVFGRNRARDAGEALENWLGVKEQERRAQAAKSGEASSQAAASGEATHATNFASLLDGIPANLPATLEAHEIGIRAAQVGFDWAKVTDLLDKVEEEIGELGKELRRERSQGESHHRLTPSSAEEGTLDVSHGDMIENRSRIEDELGDLMFAVAQLARYVRSDAESALRRANRKFRRRFRQLEGEVARSGKQLRECTPRELDGIWNAVKADENEE